MKIETATFRTSALDLEACPPSWQPEFAFVGRSNVGKSSLINMLTGKKELAKTSSVPGKTQLINFFDINQTWSLVDLPGYGYARLSKAKQNDFNINVSGYLTGRDNLSMSLLWSIHEWNQLKATSPLSSGYKPASYPYRLSSLSQTRAPIPPWKTTQNYFCRN